MHPGKRKTLPKMAICRLKDKIKQLKASVRVKVKHPFLILKNIFGMKKVRLAKHTVQLFTLFGLLANPLIITRRLFADNAPGVS